MVRARATAPAALTPREAHAQRLAALRGALAILQGGANSLHRRDVALVVQLVGLLEVHPRKLVRTATEHLAPLRLQSALARAGLLKERDLALRRVVLLAELVGPAEVRARHLVRTAAEDLAPLRLHRPLPRAAARSGDKQNDLEHPGHQ